MKKQTSAVEFISRQTAWQRELTLLRDLLLETELQETIKWGIPVYTLGGKNVVGLGAFKSYCGLWFFQGAFLKDPKNMLVNAQEGKTRGQRQMRFSSLDHIDVDAVRSYLQEAIQNQKAGKEIKAERKKLETPPELQQAMDENPHLQQAFFGLTPGKQREYAEYVSDAKREETKRSRLAKITPMILDGVGLNDRYK